MNGSILIVDDEVTLGKHLEIMLRREGFQTGLAHSAVEARGLMKRLYPDIVLQDLRLPDADGVDLMQELKRKYPDAQFVIITAFGSIQSAVESTKKGATDYLTKPFEPDELMHVIRNVMRRQALGEEVSRLREDRGLAGGARQDEMSRFSSTAMRRMLSVARRASKQEGIVLLLGESGTGKDHLARWIHSRSRRAGGPFFTVNCAALARELAESELFGHEPGAFTGSRGRKRGLLELAEKGTLLLDEIGEMDLALQSKLLTFLDTRSFVRVGGERSITIDARIFAATNRSLERSVEEGTFRQDLYYRLNVVPIRIPPLRDRPEDIPVLVEQLLGKLKEDMGLGKMPLLSGEALAALQRYHWPGNIRELRNVLERSLMTALGPEIQAEDLNLQILPREWRMMIGFPEGRNLHEVTREVARELVCEALYRGKTRQEAARLLGITRHALAYQMKTLDIDD